VPQPNKPLDHPQQTVHLGWRLAVWLSALAIAAVCIFRAEFRADISAFLPNSPSVNQKLLVDQLKDGAVSRLLFLGIEIDDSSEAKPALLVLSRQLAANLRKDERWTIVANGESIGAEKDGAFLLNNRYLLSDIEPNTWSEAGLKQVLARARQQLTQNTGLFAKELLPRDPTGEMMRMIEVLSAKNVAETESGTWMSSPVGAGKHRAVLMAQTKVAGIDLDGQEQAIAAVRQAFDDAKTTHSKVPKVQAATLLLSGPGYFSAISRDRIKSDATVFSSIATAMVVALIWFVYRSFVVMGLGLIPVVSGVLVGIAAVSLSFGYVHGLTLGFGATLIGEAVDYGVYLLTLTKRGEARATIKLIWPTLRLGVLTSIFGFCAMVLSDFSGLQQLGVFSVAGLVAAVLVTRYVLPYLIPASFQVRESGFGNQLKGIAGAAAKIRWPLGLCLCAIALAGAILQRPLWSDDLSNISPISKQEQKLDEELRAALGAPDGRLLLVVESASAEQSLQGAEIAADTLNLLVEKNVLDSFESPSQFLPSEKKQRERQQRLPVNAALQENMARSALDSGFQPNTFEPFLADVEKARIGPLITRESLRGTQLINQIDALWVERPGSFTAMLPLKGVNDDVVLTKAIADLKQPNIRLLDLKTESNGIFEAYRLQALKYAALGLLAICLLLAVTLRSFTRMLKLVLPLLCSVFVTGLLLMLMGVSLSIFHLVAFLLVVAIGSNYALFFDQFINDETLGAVLVSLVVCNLSTVFGFGVLALSSMPVLKAIGGTVAIGTVLTLVFCAVYIQPSNRPTIKPTIKPTKQAAVGSN
jgi:predicted exporter